MGLDRRRFAALMLGGAAALGLGGRADADAESDPLPSWNAGPAKDANRQIRPCDDRRRKPRLRAARGAHRDLRPGRHAVGRASDLYAARLLLRSRAGAGEGEARARQDRAVPHRAHRRSRSNREARPRAADQGPRRNPDRHGRRHVPRRGREMDRGGARSALEAALHRTRLPAADRASRLSPQRRLPHLHRHRRRTGFRARLCGARLRRPARAGGRQRRRRPF